MKIKSVPEPSQQEMKQQDFAELVCSVVSIPNPQHLVGGEPGEAALASWICSWLAERDIPHECDLAWGVHAVLQRVSAPTKLGNRS